MQQEIFKSGGIAALLALLSGINDDARVQAAACISELSQGAGGKNKKKTQDAFAKAGGIGPLLAAVSSPTSKQPLVAQATHALAMLAKGHRANQDAIATMGGLKPLVEQLQPSRPDGGQNTPLSQANAALALGSICRKNEENQTAVAELGALSQLGTLLRTNNNSEANKGLVEAEAAGALWALADGHEANKVSIAGSGAIATLCGLMGMAVERAQLHAAKALSSLCSGSPANQSETAQFMVRSLLKGNNSAAFRARTLQALWKLVEENPEHSVNIAKAGGAEVRGRVHEWMKLFPCTLPSNNPSLLFCSPAPLLPPLLSSSHPLLLPIRHSALPTCLTNGAFASPSRPHPAARAPLTRRRGGGEAVRTVVALAGP